MKNNKCTIQVDLDGLWTNLNYYGHHADVIPDHVFETSIPRFLDLFDKYNLKATFFLIGKDGEISEKAKLVKEISKAGHEIANHTYSHVFGFRKLNEKEKIDEIKKGEEIITRIIGKKPVGFKAPGYDMDIETLRILENNHYLYDSSIIATPYFPLIMKLNRLISGGVKRNHGPKAKWVFAPNKIYHPALDCEWKNGKKREGSGESVRTMKLLELPCSVSPFFRLPFHATFATKFGWNYFNLNYKLFKRNRFPLNYEFHALDLSDNMKENRIPHTLDFEKRYSIVESIIKKISSDYEVISSKDLATRFL